ncbi:aspartyl protease family protein [Gallaecimonas kandeliae]|uniref:aspartyl protease family protein n=1 Tax=Gallaecimonas kandeliae TaxID=3029055 RepID=UPI002648BFDE|nr:aspartyl protease family protein [Gallaecimonas kandeliae]WKE65532.1 aspartyl protease family protein [Gallaecimonas kandeliae]
MKKTALRCLWLLAAALPFCSQAAVTPWIPFELENGAIELPVTIAGIKTKAILDSGSQLNGINEDFIKANKLEFGKGSRIRVKGVYDEVEHSTYNKVPVSLFGSTWNLDGLVSMPFGDEDAALLLGGSLFENFIVQIDYPHSKLRLVERKSLDLRKAANIEMRSDPHTGMPIVKVELNKEKSVWLMLDTGNTGGLMLPRSLANDQHWLERYPTKDTLGQGVNTIGENDSFRLPEMTFGPFELENILVTVPKDGSVDVVEAPERGSVFEPIHNVKVRGLLGFDVIKHFLLTIDYKEGRMHVGLPPEDKG